MPDIEQTKIRERLLAETLRGEIPTHVAVIMDGNGRWAEARGLPRWEGHREGAKAVREAVIASLKLGVRHLTLYAFSNENWLRPTSEITALMDLLVEYAESEESELRERGVRVNFFGDLERISPEARQAVDRLSNATRVGSALSLHLALSYGSRSEISRAARRLVSAALAGQLKPEEVDAERFERELYTAGLPDPDLLIRTSGEQRLSNFLLWQIAYAELLVTPVLWPDFDRAHFFEAILEYQRRERRYGRVEV
ncbi:MAG: polyprenyl diphosphate synthase [Gemmatimonadales bacterium]